jgi:hypothetical protein
LAWPELEMLAMYGPCGTALPLNEVALSEVGKEVTLAASMVVSYIARQEVKEEETEAPEPETCKTTPESKSPLEHAHYPI